MEIAPRERETVPMEISCGSLTPSRKVAPPLASEKDFVVRRGRKALEESGGFY